MLSFTFKDKLILLFIFFNFISCELEEEDMIRAFSCLNIVTKNIKKDEDSQTKYYSPYMLSCFIKITNEQMKTIFSGIEDDKEDLNSLEEEEIQNLLDLDSLQDIPEKELKKYSVKLEKTMKKFEKMDKEIERMYKKNQKENDDIDDKELSSFDDDNDDDFNYNDDDFDYDDDDVDDDYDDDDEDYSSLKKRRRQKGFFRIFLRGIKRFFNNSNIWFAFLFIIGIYLLLLAMRKSFEADKEEKTKKDDEKTKDKDKEKNEKENGNKENKEKEKEDKNIKKENEKEKVKKD